MNNNEHERCLCSGTIKKGKAARQGQELLSRASDALARERELIKGVPEMDMINAMVCVQRVGGLPEW